MRKFLASMLAAAVVFFAGNALAATQIPLYGDKTIVAVGSYADTGYVRISPAISGLEGCSGAGDHLYIDWTTEPNKKSMYATMLAAILAGQKILVGAAGCNSSGSALIYRVDVIL